MEIKICGIRRKEDIDIISKYKPDYIGFIFAKSKREVTPETVAEITKNLDKDIKKVGVFVNATYEKINEAVQVAKLDVVQLHGDENDEYISNLDCKCEIWKAVRVRDGEDIYGDMDVNVLRKRVGMVFQKPNPFPMSIYDNVAYGPRTHGIRSKAKLDEIVEKSLRDAAIWDEVKDRLKKSALGMSGGQQQRLCIARALAVEPEVLLMDEPTSALDPISTSKIEELAMELKGKYTIVIVTHNMQQATRISDKTAFFLLGEVVEFSDTDTLFSMPKDKRTEDYITGRFG